MSFFNHSSECASCFMYKIKTDTLDQWSGDRKRRFLLKNNINPPRSVDMAIWDDFDKKHSEFQTCDVDCHPDFELADDHSTLLISMPVTDYRHFFSYLDNSEIYWPQWIQCLNTDAIQLDFLGYDVADFMLMSGINNCGYEVGDRKLFEQYIPYINEYGLVSDLDAADSIRKLNDQRVPEHAPFYIFGIYEIKARPKI